jgi:hypothetical protein
VTENCDVDSWLARWASYPCDDYKDLPGIVAGDRTPPIEMTAKSSVGTYAHRMRNGFHRYFLCAALVEPGTCHSAFNQRAAASAVSSGRVLNAMRAVVADLCTAFTIASNSSKLFGGIRMPPPITTQSYLATAS